MDLVSRSHEADDVWVRLNEAQDRTMSAVGKIFLGIETEYKENELDKPKRTGHAGACQQSCRNGNKNSNSNDVVKEVFLRRVNVPAAPLLKTVIFSWSLISNVQMFNTVSKSVTEVFEIENCSGHRASADISCVLPC